LPEQRYSAFLGVAVVLEEKFLVFADQCKKASSLKGMEVYELSSLAFLSFSQEQHFKENPQRKQIYETFRDYYVILRQGFYFSHQYNLHLSFPQQDKGEKAEHFIWNQMFLRELEKQGVAGYWQTPLIQGFVGSF
jgi:hypothetical protein